MNNTAREHRHHHHDYLSCSTTTNTHCQNAFSKHYLNALSQNAFSKYVLKPLPQCTFSKCIIKTHCQITFSEHHLNALSQNRSIRLVGIRRPDPAARQIRMGRRMPSRQCHVRGAHEELSRRTKRQLVVRSNQKSPVEHHWQKRQDEKH